MAFTTAVGVGMKAYGDYSAGQARGNLADMNAKIASEQARSEMASGSYNANLVRQKGAKVMGQQVAAIGANNLQQTGTNATVVADTARATEMDALMTQNNALRRAWGFEVQGASDTYQGKLARAAGLMSGIGDIVSGGTSMYAAGMI